MRITESTIVVFDAVVQFHDNRLIIDSPALASWTLSVVYNDTLDPGHPEP